MQEEEIAFWKYLSTATDSRAPKAVGHWVGAVPGVPVALLVTQHARQALVAARAPPAHGTPAFLLSTLGCLPCGHRHTEIKAECTPCLFQSRPSDSRHENSLPTAELSFSCSTTENDTSSCLSRI